MIADVSADTAMSVLSRKLYELPNVLNTITTRQARSRLQFSIESSRAAGFFPALCICNPSSNASKRRSRNLLSLILEHSLNKILLVLCREHALA